MSPELNFTGIEKGTGKLRLHVHPGKPVDNCFIESFNSRFRNECLNSHYFDSISEAKVLGEDWRKMYNEFRPHRTLKDLTPKNFARQYKIKSTQNTNLAMAY